MADRYIELLGIEQFQNLTRHFASDIEEFRRNVGWLTETLDRFILRFNQEIDRLEALNERKPPCDGTCAGNELGDCSHE